MEKVSVIVPVYNVSKYLEPCVNSVINQSYSDLEIILVDDGSLDGSSAICDSFSQKDTRIIVIHKQNGGQGSARNAALDICSGEFIIFLDSDDSIKQDAVDILVCKLKELDADIVISNSENYYENGKKVGIRTTLNNEKRFTAEEAIESLWYQGPINIAPWGKIYKRYLWENIRFQETFSEDYATMHKVYANAENIWFIPNVTVNYLIRRNSSIRSFNENKLIMLSIAQETIMWANTRSVKLKNAALHKALCVNFHIYMQLPLDEKYKAYSDKCMDFIKKNRTQVLRNPHCTLKAKAAIVVSYLSPQLVKIILKLIHKIRPGF